MISNKIKFLANLSFLISIIFISFNCSKDSSVTSVQPAAVHIIVKSYIDSSAVAGANVVLYNANSGEAKLRASSGTDGVVKFDNLSAGTFYVRIASQGFKELPAGNISPIPFSVTEGQTYSQSYFLDTLQGIFGMIDGKVTPNQSGFLVVASSTNSGTEIHSYSGPDGYFALFNIPFGTYNAYAIKSGYQSDTTSVIISPEFPSKSIQIISNPVIGSTLKGMVTFLATPNGIVNISILDKNSMSVISGLTARIDSNRNYIINNIPSGDYVAWASYENDHYVMDPDWIFKNPGALNFTFTTDIDTELNFSVTGTIIILSPTNPDEEITPALADSIVPTFRWDSYPQAKEYIIEVRDLNGNLIWGGFTESGVIRHSQIPKELNSVEFNFDGSATFQLQPGEIYQWKIYADDDAAPNVQTLLSSSEDLKGLFLTPNR